MRGFHTETEMEDAYIVAQAKNLLLFAVAVVFEQYNTTDIQYKIRHSWKIPNSLYQSALGERMTESPKIYFDIVPIVQVQMCVDQVLINQVAPDSMSNIKVKILKKKYTIYHYVLFSYKYTLHMKTLDNMTI